MNSIIECVRNYIMDFPELDENRCLLVEYLGDKAIEYTVEATPCDPIYKQYTDGEKVKQFEFIFASRQYFSADVNTCIDNLHFYEKFEDWIEGNNDNGVLPDLGESRTPVSLEVLTKGSALSAEADTARYQIQLRLIYEEVKNVNENSTTP